MEMIEKEKKDRGKNVVEEEEEPEERLLYEKFVNELARAKYREMLK